LRSDGLAFDIQQAEAQPAQAGGQPAEAGDELG
jgi:hypothetical protein